MMCLKALLITLSLTLGLCAQALILDCRTPVSRRDGYMVYISETQGRIQAVENDELSGPVFWGELQTPPVGYLYVLRLSLTDHEMPSFYEIWIPEPHDTEDIQAWFFDYGPTLQSPQNQVGVKGLRCSVISEPIPRIFRSQI